jgi:FkbM family methyltransferase
VRPAGDLVTIGDPAYGGWTVPRDGFGPDSVCYLAGIGTDASFDLGLIERFGCTVHAFDPVPEAGEYARGVAEREPRFVFRPLGLWSEDTTLRFYDNPEPGFVSRSATNMHSTGGFLEAHVRSVPSLMRELGHERVDLLKLSVEGSEYEILRDVLGRDVPVRVLLVEFAQPAPGGRVRGAVTALGEHGFALVHADLRPFNWKLTFLRSR